MSADAFDGIAPADMTTACQKLGALEILGNIRQKGGTPPETKSLTVANGDSSRFDALAVLLFVALAKAMCELRCPQCDGIADRIAMWNTGTNEDAGPASIEFHCPDCGADMKALTDF